MQNACRLGMLVLPRLQLQFDGCCPLFVATCAAMAHGDASVKARLCQREVLTGMMGLAPHMRLDQQVTSCSCIWLVLCYGCALAELSGGSSFLAAAAAVPGACWLQPDGTYSCGRMCDGCPHAAPAV